MVKKQPTVISLFCGCGGSSLGYKWAGYKELLAIDFDKNSVDTFRLNFPDVPCWQRDIREVTGKEILDFCKLKPGGLDLLDASPPCQGFSTAGKRKVTDPRNDLFKEFVRLIGELKPKVFVMENVSGMAKGLMKGIFNDALRQLRGCGYQVKCKLMNAKWYGVPQFRQRVIFIGRYGNGSRIPSFPPPNKEIVPVKQVLGDLPLGKPGRHQPQVIDAWYKSRPGMVLRKACRFVGSFQSCRLDPNDVSPTLIKAHRHWHYAVPRQLNDLELKRICSFPDEFQFPGRVDGRSGNQVGQRLGNAVMPKFMQAIASHIKETLLNV